MFLLLSDFLLLFACLRFNFIQSFNNYFQVFVYQKPSLQLQQQMGDSFKRSTPDNYKKKMLKPDAIRVRTYMDK